MNVHLVAALLVTVSMFGCAATSPPGSQEDFRLQVVAVETAFARTMAERDHVALSTFIAADAVFFAGDMPLRGREEVVDWWARYYTDPDAPFSWQSSQVEILESGSLAYSSGPVRDPDGNVVGRFNSIWRNDGDGNWKVIFDKGSDVCNCSAED